jgi:hypothetical protein
VSALRLIALCLLSATACERAETNATPSPPSAVSVAGPSVELRLDGEVVRKIPHDELRGRVVLTDLLGDRQKWQQVSVRSSSGARLVVSDAPRRLNGRELAFYAGLEGKPAFGLFRKLTATMSPAAREHAKRPSLFVQSVAVVEVWTVTPPVEAKKPPSLGVPLRVEGREDVVQISEAYLTKLAQVGDAAVLEVLVAGRRGEVKKKRHVHRGWELRRVIRGLIKPRKVAEVIITGRKGDEIVISGAALEDKRAASRLLLLLNERGVLNYHGIRRADAGNDGVDRLRDIVGIRIEQR